MSRADEPYDNALAERFMSILNEEDVSGKAYASIDEVRTDIGALLENVLLSRPAAFTVLVLGAGRNSPICGVHGDRPAVNARDAGAELRVARLFRIAEEHIPVVDDSVDLENW